MKKRILFIKKVVLLCSLLFVFLFALAQRNTFHETREYYALNVFEDTVDLPEGEQTLDQRFIAKQSELQETYIKFYIEDLVKLDGVVTVQYVDDDENVVIERIKSLSNLVATEDCEWTMFDTPGTLEKGREYTLRVRVRRNSSEGVIKIYTSSNKQGLFKSLTVNGEESSKRLISTFKYDTYCIGDLYRMIVLLCLTALYVLLYGTWMSNKINHLCQRFGRKVLKGKVLKGKGKFLGKDKNQIRARVIFALAPFMAFYIVQTLGSYNFPDFLEQVFSIKGLINLCIYGILLGLTYLITNRTKYAAILTTLIPYVMFLINYFVWNIRECPIVAADFASFKTAMNVAGNYQFIMGLHAVWATVLLVCYWCVVLMCESYKGLQWKRRIALLLINAMLVGGAYGIFFKTDLMQKLDITVSVWKPERNYAKNGSALSFILTWTYYVVEKPSGYSPAKVKEITKNYVSDDVSDENIQETKPNIIAIMNESFADLTVDADLETSEDFMPFVRGLKENTVKGNLYVSVLGGNTANSEYEFLTGNSLAFFPSRSVPYNSYVKTKEGSLTWTLKAQDYEGNFALHPYYADGWNRPTVYPLLGFDEFFANDSFYIPTYVRDFISDDRDFTELIAKYEEYKESGEEGPFYEFNVTMQNHGGYSGLHGLVKEDISVLRPENPNDQLVQYVNLIKKSDEAFEKLVHYFETVDEPTVIVMFGDHQPGFTDSVYDGLMGANTNTLGIEDTVKMYQTPYVIWANYDIPEEEIDMSANYLSSYLLKLTGNKMTGYNKYLLDLMKKMPIISGICYQGDDGVLHAADEKSEYSSLLHEYQMIQYNHVFDEKNRADEFFFLKE